MGLRKKHRLSADDKKAFEQYYETGNLNILAGFFFKGFTFMPWQHQLATSPVGDTVVLGGVGCGKTVGHAIEELLWGLLVPNYASMTLAPTSWQANLTFRSMVEWMTDSVFEKFLAKDPVRRPWPEIQLTTGARFEFRSASDINLIQGWQGDSMTIDEAGVIQNGEEVFSGMASRLRGLVRLPDGSSRVRRGRLGIISASYLGGEWVFNRYDQPKARNEVVFEGYNKEIKQGHPSHFLQGPDQISMTVISEANVGLTELDIKRMRRRIAEHLVDIQMGAARPMGMGEVFTEVMVNLCEDWGMNAEMEEKLRDEKVGWEEKTLPALSMIGPVLWKSPAKRGNVYMLLGDPGTGNPPNRNSPVIMVFDVTMFPKEPARLVYFHWVHGNGTINPFLADYFAAYNEYQPQFCMFDATSTQKYIDETVFQGYNMPVEGFDFSGMKKNGAIGALKFLMSRALIKFPYISAIRNQLTGYVLPDTNLAQDLVSTMCMAAGKLRTFVMADAAAVGEDVPEPDINVARNKRSARRTRRSGDRR